jgi:2-(1,2-epoxy-1,2-dihydrophenyl)acetyl-CoA isomerase
MDDLVTYDVADGVAHLELNRPHAGNALDLHLTRALRAAVDRAGADEEVRSVLVTGSGNLFCAGGDLGSILAAVDPAAYLLDLATEADAAIRVLAGLVKPVVGSVHGAVAGAGLGLMLSCDVVVAGSDTKFVFAYPTVGLTPDCGVSYLLPRAIGQQRALSFGLTGQSLTADQALAWGLVSELDDDVVARGRALAVSLAAGPARALGQARRLLRESWETDRVAAGTEEARTISELVMGEEAHSRISRFVAR